MQTRDEVEGLHNWREFSQCLECLYQAMQIQEKRFLLLLEINFSKNKCKLKLFFMALIKREILISHEVLCTKSCMRYQFFFLQKRQKRGFPKYRFFSLEFSVN